MTTISPSAVETYLLCQRRWGFQRLDGLPRSSSPGADLGTRCHELWAKYLKDGTPFDLTTIEGRICHATQHLLPKPSPYMNVESPFTFEFDGVPWAGIRDLLYVEEDGTLVVLDHKTTSNLKYAKTDRESLLGHPQAPSYSVPLLATSGLDSVRLAWNYVQHGVQFDKETGAMKARSKPYALDPPVRIDVTKTEAEERLGVFSPPAKRMLQLIKDPPAKVDGFHAKALEPTPSACNAFHTQCPYTIQCALTPHEVASRLVTIGKVSTMSSMSERIAQMRAEKLPTHSSSTAAQQIEEQIAAERAKAGYGHPLEQSTASDWEKGAKAGYGPINPPEAVLGAQGSTALPAAVLGAQEGMQRVTGPAVLGAQEGMQRVTGLGAQGSTPLPAAPATEPAQPRRGRPPGSRNKVKDALNKPLPDGAVPAQAFEDVTGCIEVPDTIPAPNDRLIDIAVALEGRAEAALDRLIDIAERIAVALEARAQ